MTSFVKNLVFLSLVLPSLASASCDYESDFTFSKTDSQWTTELSEAKTYVDKSVKSKIGSFHIEINGGVYERMKVEHDVYSCESDGYTHYRYSFDRVIDRESSWEKATQIVIQFPNGYEISSDDDELSEKKYELTTKGLKQIGPFAPAGPLSDVNTILAVGKIKLEPQDYEQLKSSF